MIFCEGTLTFAAIIESCSQLPTGVKIKFHAAGSKSIVGSDSKSTTGNTLSVENGYRLGNPYNRRLKRLIDISFSLLALVTFPIHLFGISKPAGFFSNCLSVLFAQKTWIGYALSEKKLPPLRSGIIACNGVPLSSLQQMPEESLRAVDQWYAADYEPVNDWRILFRNYKKLGA